MVQIPSHDVSGDERQWSPEWLKSDTKAKMAEALLQSIDPNITVEWAPKGKTAGIVKGPDGRRIVQLDG